MAKWLLHWEGIDIRITGTVYGTKVLLELPQPEIALPIELCCTPRVEQSDIRLLWEHKRYGHRDRESSPSARSLFFFSEGQHCPRDLDALETPYRVVMRC